MKIATFFCGPLRRTKARSARARRRVQAAAAITRRGSRTVKLQKGLTPKAAYRAASAELQGTGFDFRGFSYNPRTGKAVCT